MPSGKSIYSFVNYCLHNELLVLIISARHSDTHLPGFLNVIFQYWCNLEELYDLAILICLIMPSKSY